MKITMHYTALAAGSLILLLSPRAEAACASAAAKAGFAATKAPGLAAHLNGSDDDSKGGSNGSIVGLWITTFLVGQGPAIWDQGFEQWHSDGTELNVDNAVPPTLGNVCVGVWKQEGRTIRLRHFTFNWNPDGTKAGTFTLLMTATVGHGGKSLSGRYVSDSYDLEGNVIPELHGEGVVRATRITAD